MGRGLSKQQIAILNILDEKHGTASTKTLKIAMGSTISNQSFYRSLQNLEKRGEIRFFRGGRVGGLVCKKHGNVLLVDVDSMIPNLALMKLSAWHNAKGDNVTLQKGKKSRMDSRNTTSHIFLAFFPRMQGPQGDSQKYFQQA